MTPREVVLAQIDHQETDPVPYTLGMEGDISAALDAHYGSKDWRQRLVTYIGSCGGIDRRQCKAISDTHGRDVWGSLWRTDKRPFHLEEPALTWPSFDGYEMPGPDAFTNPDLKATAARIRAEHPDRFLTVGLGWGLWESCWGIRGFENALTDCVLEPDFFEELLDRFTDLYLAQVQMCAEVDADAIMYGDDWGDQRDVMIGPERWRRYMKPRYARIFEATHAQGKLVISHCCGSVASIMPDIIEIGMDVLESVQPEAGGMNPYELKRRWGDKITFWGGLGSQSTVSRGTPAEIHAEVGRLRREMGKGGGYILAPAKPVQPGTPLENAVAMVEAFTASA